MNSTFHSRASARKPRARTAHESAAASILAAADLITRRSAEFLRPFGITPQQFNVLRIVASSGEVGMPTLAIAERLVEDAPGITRMLDRMQRQGWIVRERCATDRRLVLCRLSPSGTALMREIEPELDDLFRFSLGRLPPKRSSQLVQLLALVTAE